MKRTCGNCEQTDGNVYTSNPPQVRCNLTNDYHFMNDECTVECVPIVRCKDCKYYVSDGGALVLCGLLGRLYFADTDFCSYGEKKQ